jgi:hypothetical protein
LFEGLRRHQFRTRVLGRVLGRASILGITRAAAFLCTCRARPDGGLGVNLKQHHPAQVAAMPHRLCVVGSDTTSSAPKFGPRAAYSKLLGVKTCVLGRVGVAQLGWLGIWSPLGLSLCRFLDPEEASIGAVPLYTA